VLPGALDTDVLGVSRHADRAAVATLVVRGGRVIGKETRILERAGAIEDAELLRQIIVLHYLGRAELPRRIVIAGEPADCDATREALRQRAGRDVELLVPQRGRGRRMVRNAERNAALALEDLVARRAGRRAWFSADVVDLQRALGLATPPHRMVCFDISNLGAEHAVAAVVASENGRARKGLYRRMRVRRPGPRRRVDDPRSRRALLDARRIGRAAAPRPRRHRRRHRAAPRGEHGARDREHGARRRDRARQARGGDRARGPAAAPPAAPQPGAARAAASARRGAPVRADVPPHAARRSRVASALDEVPGIGPARRAALLKAFGSVAALSAASEDDIVERAAVPRSIARRVHEALASAAPAAGEPTAASEPLPPLEPHSDVHDDEHGEDTTRRAAGGERR
jgi:excinuclease ABC subunit C